MLPGVHGIQPAAFAVLNLLVDDVEAAVDALAARGVRFERDGGFPAEAVEKGIDRGAGPDIAGFTDLSGNVLSVISRPG